MFQGTGVNRACFKGTVGNRSCFKGTVGNRACFKGTVGNRVCFKSTVVNRACPSFLKWEGWREFTYYSQIKCFLMLRIYLHGY